MYMYFCKIGKLRATGERQTDTETETEREEGISSAFICMSETTHAL